MAIIHKKNTDIRQDKNILSLLERMPDEKVKNSFSDEQLESLKIAMGARDWKTHPVDIRFTLPFFGRRYYVVFIAGKSIRVGRLQKLIFRKAEIIFLSIAISVSFLFILLLLYFAKSFVGLNFFPDFSFGLWDWIQG